MDKETDMYGATAIFKGGKVEPLAGARKKQEAAELRAKIDSSKDLSEFTVKQVMQYVEDGLLSRQIALDKENAGQKREGIIKPLEGNA